LYKFAAKSFEVIDASDRLAH